MKLSVSALALLAGPGICSAGILSNSIVGSKTTAQHELDFNSFRGGLRSGKFSHTNQSSRQLSTCSARDVGGGIVLPVMTPDTSTGSTFSVDGSPSEWGTLCTENARDTSDEAVPGYICGNQFFVGDMCNQGNCFGTSNADDTLRARAYAHWDCFSEGGTLHVLVHSVNNIVIDSGGENWITLVGETNGQVTKLVPVSYQEIAGNGGVVGWEAKYTGLINGDYDWCTFAEFHLNVAGQTTSTGKSRSSVSRPFDLTCTGTPPQECQDPSDTSPCASDSGCCLSGTCVSNDDGSGNPIVSDCSTCVDGNSDNICDPPPECLAETDCASSPSCCVAGKCVSNDDGMGGFLVPDCSACVDNDNDGGCDPSGGCTADSDCDDYHCCIGIACIYNPNGVDCGACVDDDNNGECDPVCPGDCNVVFSNSGGLLSSPNMLDTTICPSDDVDLYLDNSVFASDCQSEISVIPGDTSSDPLCGNSITRTWEVPASGCNSGGYYTQTITYGDSEAPVIDAPSAAPLEIECTAAGSYETSAFATDNCRADIDHWDVDDTSTCGNTKVITRTWTATDDCGQSASIDQIVTVVDTTLPSIVKPADITVECGSSTAPDSTGSATGSDICGSVTIDYGDYNALGCGATETITRTWYATDECGNTAPAAQTITVEDTTKPDVYAPSDATFECRDPCVANGLSADCAGFATASDICDPTVSTSYADATTAITAGAEVVRTWTATDACGNFQTAQQKIVVMDTCDFTIYEAFSGASVDVTVSITNKIDETGAIVGVVITVAYVDPAQADIRGVFFKVGKDDLSGVYVEPHPDITMDRVEKGAVDRLSRDVTMKGGGNNAHVYDIGVQVGTSGIGNDDIPTITFTVFGLTTTDVEGQEFGVRLTSVSANGVDPREDSSKIFGGATCCSYEPNTPPPPPPPTGSCGDGMLDQGEDCDDGNNVDGDGCSSVCTIETCEINSCTWQ